MYDFLIGPMLALSLLVFIGGMTYRIRQFFKLSEEVKPAPHVDLPKTVRDSIASREQDDYIQVNSARDLFLKWQLKLRRTLLGRAPVFSAVTILFHIVLLIIPIVTVAHNVLLDSYFGFRFPTLAEETVDSLTLLFMAGVLFFLLRRIVVAKVRAVSTWRDYLALALTAAPFVTGYLAFHQFFDYQTILYIHIIAGELMLIGIPFTKLAHMPFFILSRFLIRNELTLGSGTRKWVANS